MIGEGTMDRYCRLLGVEAEPSSIDHLERLVRAQIIRVPFENVSKLYLGRTRAARFIPALEEHLDGIERHGFGGTCYANNAYFAELLRHLGYDVTLCGAAMSRPDVHMVSIVRLAGREHLVDVGYAAPFFGPMPRDLEDPYEIQFGRSRFVLHPRDREGRSRMDHLRNGTRIHGYLVSPVPRTLEHFEDVIRGSYSPEAIFMQVVVVERFSVDRSIRIHNFRLTEATPAGETVRHLTDRDELADAVEREGGIRREIVREAIEGIPLEGDIYA